jgi:UDP-N-acetylmuramate--alanine ligase
MIAAGLEVSRRRQALQIKSNAGVTVIDDYAHHPTEIRATLNAAKAEISSVSSPSSSRIDTRTFHLFDDFARAFNLADVVLMLDIYPAGEAPIVGITTEALIREDQELRSTRTRCMRRPSR